MITLSTLYLSASLASFVLSIATFAIANNRHVRAFAKPAQPSPCDCAYCRVMEGRE